MYVKEEVLSIYFSLDLIIKAEEPIVFYDYLIFSLVFSKLQGSSQNDNAQIRTGTNRKIGIVIIWMLFSIVKSYCLCCCEVLGPQLFFDFTSGLKKKTVVTQIRAMAFLILSSLKCNAVLKGLSKALYLSTASTVTVMEETIARVVMRADALPSSETQGPSPPLSAPGSPRMMPCKPSARNFHQVHVDWRQIKPVSCKHHYGEDITNDHVS